MCRKFNMAAPKKKRVEEEMDNDVIDIDQDDIDDDDAESESDEEPMDEEVQLDFEARTPEDCDFNGMKTLLQQVFLKANVNLSELTDTIISQNYVGSVVKQPYNPEDDDSDDDAEDSVLALTTVVNLSERKDLDCVKQLKAMLQDKCHQCCKAGAQKDFPARFGKLLHDPDSQVGYLISERFLNLPPTLAVPMFESLVKEMTKASQKNMKYTFSHYVMICKTYEMKAAHNVCETFFSNSEEELFQEAADLSFRYSVAHERDSVVQKWSAEEDMEPFRTVIVFTADKLQSLIDKIKLEVAKT